MVELFNEQQKEQVYFSGNVGIWTTTAHYALHVPSANPILTIMAIDGGGGGFNLQAFLRLIIQR